MNKYIKHLSGLYLDTLINFYLESGIHAPLASSSYLNRIFFYKNFVFYKKIIHKSYPLYGKVAIQKREFFYMSQINNLLLDPSYIVNNHPAYKATNLITLYKSILDFRFCDLKRSANNTVFSDGVKDAPIMVIGEAPGVDEDRIGKPFVGLSGKLLDSMFKIIGLFRSKNLYITNMLPWRPPKNRQPTQQEISLFLPFVEKHIALVKPKLLVECF